MFNISKLDRPKTLDMPVFAGASAVIVLLLVVTAASPDWADTLFQRLQAGITANGSWFYVLVVALILVFVLYLGFSRYGDIKLGLDHQVPDYSYLTWLSMLFAAGMGIGLMFFGVAEPVMHFLAPPTAEAGTVDAVREAMKVTFFHWGLHAWAIYAIVALVLAYFSFRHQLPLTLRSALYPMIGERIYQWPGHLVDIFAVIGTVFGVATSLGFGVLQVNSGLNYLFELPVSTTVQVVLIVAITGLAMLSVSLGLDTGIRRLSETNMILAVGLLLLVLVLGPTVFLLQAFVQNIGLYLSDLVRNTFNLFAYEKTDWLGGWTIFYWGWWLAWAPFVGLFIARISRGRTIREFVLGVLLIPSGFTLMWMTFFGNSAIDLILNQGMTAFGDTVSEDTAVALFVFLEQFPLSSVLSFIGVLMVVIFFVTSCDSGAMVVDMLCSHGNNETPIWQRLYWSGGVGLVAAILLMAGGLGALQTMTIASALPFSVVLLLALMGLMKSLRIESYKRESLQMHVAPMHMIEGQDGWRERLHNIMNFPSRNTVTHFLQRTVKPAFNAIGDELKDNGVQTQIEPLDDDGIRLTISHGDEPDFIYAVYCREQTQPDFSAADQAQSSAQQTYYRAEVHLREGGLDYDIMNWSRVAVINDIVEQYEKHMHFLHLLR